MKIVSLIHHEPCAPNARQYNHVAWHGTATDDGAVYRVDGDSSIFSPRAWNPAEGQQTCWPDYCEVQRNVTTVIVENYCEGDIVWIHHYHHMLLPAYLARKLPSANIGIFMHQPFPSSEIFRCLSNREELLRGLLCADHIGFHLYE